MQENTLPPEILLNAKQVTHSEEGETYEFILNTQLQVIECIKIASHMRGMIQPIQNIQTALNGCLFELYHVRVNPKVNNSVIIGVLTNALNEIGVNVINAPNQNSMEICYRPLGEISDNVRFYLGPEKKLIFLSPACRPKVIDCTETSSPRPPLKRRF